MTSQRSGTSSASTGCSSSCWPESTDGRVRFAVDGDHLDDAVRALGQFEIRSLTSHPPTLEELMLRHYGDELAAAGNGKMPGNGNGEER
jgi:ABC-2 type transport system ATP-binding protein